MKHFDMNYGDWLQLLKKNHVVEATVVGSKKDGCFCGKPDDGVNEGIVRFLSVKHKRSGQRHYLKTVATTVFGTNPIVKSQGVNVWSWPL